MKLKSIILTAATTISLVTATMAQVPNYLPINGLIGWYPFNGNANDLSGNGNNGTVNGASLTSDRNSISNRAYSFNGASNYVSINLINALNTTNVNGLTLSGWTNMTSLTNQPQSIIFMVDNLNNGFNTGYDYTSTKLYGQAGNTGVPASFFISSVNTVLSNNWYNVVMTCDFNTKTSKFYINGVLQSQSSSTLITPVLTKIFIGSAYNQVWYQNGKLDDIGIWNRALTQQEITSLYQSCNLGTSINPVISNINTSSNAVFNATTNDPNATYQWQTNGVNLGWQNVPINSNYTGATSNSLTINNVQLANHLQPFRVIATSGSCIDTSNIAKINITDTCIATINNTITTLISVTDTLIINATVTGITPPNNLNTIKVFPNPANDHITINYGNFASMNSYKLKITNNLGQVVFTTPINQQSSYIDLSTWTGNGIYFVQIIDAQNNTIENRKIVIQ